MKPLEIIPRFDAFLEEQGLSLDAVIIGGTALGLLGVISRQTRDCDVLYPALSEPIRWAAAAFAAMLRAQGETLDDDWLNEGPAQVAASLPGNWQSRVQVVFRGRALTLRTLGRMDLLRTKIFALCDRAIDLADCLALAPTSEELDEILKWIEPQDANPGWPAHTRDVISDLRRRLGHGL